MQTNVATKSRQVITGEELFWGAVRAELARTRRTQGWLAERVGVSPNTVSKWMNRKAQVTLRDAFTVAWLLELSLSDLLRMGGER